MEHLASFDATIHAADGSTTGSMRGGDDAGTLMSPDEAMRRLQLLMTRRSIWTTRVTLVVTRNKLKIFDTETNAVMERFVCMRVRHAYYY